MRAAAAVGPKAAMPASDSASTNPATSGASGPTTTRSAGSCLATPTSPSTSSAPTSTHSTSRAMPAWPVAQSCSISLLTSGVRCGLFLRVCTPSGVRVLSITNVGMVSLRVAVRRQFAWFLAVFRLTRKRGPAGLARVERSQPEATGAAPPGDGDRGDLGPRLAAPTDLDGVAATCAMGAGQPLVVPADREVEVRGIGALEAERDAAIQVEVQAEAPDAAAGAKAAAENPLAGTCPG